MTIVFGKPIQIDSIAVKGKKISSRNFFSKYFGIVLFVWEHGRGGEGHTGSKGKGKSVTKGKCGTLRWIKRDMKNV